MSVIQCWPRRGGFGVLARDRASAGEFIQVVPVMFRRFDEQLDVIDRTFEAIAEVREPAVEKVVRQQTKDCDAQPAGRCNQCFRDAAADFDRRQLKVVQGKNK